MIRYPCQGCLLTFFFLLMILLQHRSTLFPTRRSSDLRCTASALARSFSNCEMSAPETNALSPAPASTTTRIEASAAKSPRSEEHTSELQSHVNLVCRLLLEKKKENDTLHCAF